MALDPTVAYTIHGAADAAGLIEYDRQSGEPLLSRFREGNRLGSEMRANGWVKLPRRRISGGRSVVWVHESQVRSRDPKCIELPEGDVRHVRAREPTRD